MASTLALSLSKWVLRGATRFIKADARLHNADVLQDDMAVIFVVNHFTRIETVLLPYIIHKHTGRKVWALAAAALFKGALGRFLSAVGAVSTRDPDRDKTIVHSLLNGEHPWLIFPEGAMIKDKKVVDYKGEFEVFSNGMRRPPHTGAAVLALRAEFYRHKIACLHARPGQDGLRDALDMFNLETAEEILHKRTVIVPVNITYFPMRAKENPLLRLAQRFRDDLDERAIDELSVEGTVLSNDTDIDITLGAPIDVREYLDRPEYADVMACGMDDMTHLENDTHSTFNQAARELMLRYMGDIYQLARVNHDHLFALLLERLPGASFSERSFRNRVFMCAARLKELGEYRMHTMLEKTYRDLVFEDPSPKFNSFIALCLREGLLTRDGDIYTKNPDVERGTADFHTIRCKELTEVITNEVEPLTRLTELVEKVARLPRWRISRRIRERFLAEDKRYFEADYAEFHDPESAKPVDVGRPFLLKPRRIKGGIVLAHGYLAAPLEVRALAEYFYAQGYAVYGVRLRGHGTSPEDLAATAWTDWYASFNRGYAIIKTLTDNIVLGGFSTGGCMALIGAARKGKKVQAAFSICAPLQVRRYGLRFVPAGISVNALLKRIGRNRDAWEYFETEPENAHINYNRNPLTGVRELIRAIDAMETALPEVDVPTLIIQGSKDPVVHPVSGQLIFDKLGASYKELTVFERARHGIVNGEGSEDVFARVRYFLERAPRHAAVDNLEGPRFAWPFTPDLRRIEMTLPEESKTPQTSASPK